MTDDHTTDQGQDAGGHAHSGLDEPHPGGDPETPRSDRDTGGPTAPADAEDISDQQPGTTGTRENPFDSHE